MDEINKQVVRARRRMLINTWLELAIWSLFAGLLVAAVGIAIPKIWYLDFLDTAAARETWSLAWIGGAVITALATATVWSWRSRESLVHAAVEVDHRFGLKSRISSSLAMSADDQESAAGRALRQDAQQRAVDLDIGEAFPVRARWTAWLPLAAIAVVVGLVFVPDALQQVAAEEVETFDRRELEVRVEEFKKKVDEQRKQLDAQGLTDAGEELKSLGMKFDQMLADKNLDRKQTLVRLNDIKKQIEDRRKSIGSTEEFKENLNRLKDVGQGEVKKLADAMGEGDFEKAKTAIKELADKLKDGELKPEAAKKLADDLKQMAKAVQQAAQQREREKQELQNQIDQAVKNGDLNKAAQLQEQLDQKKQSDQQQQQLDKMAQQLQEAAQQLQQAAEAGKPGEAGQAMQEMDLDQLKQAMKEAGQSMEQIAEQMEELQKQLQEMQALEDLEQIAEECKQGCQNGGGEGQKQGDKPNWQDWAKGAGPGGGKREMEENETGNFKARVAGKVGTGQTVVTGSADGDNITGRSASETREMIRAPLDRDVDPLENQKLSKKQREHARQYFEALRENR